MSSSRTVGYLLRIGFAMCFIGHGAFGLLQKREWLPFFHVFGIGDDTALALMPLVGAVDITIGFASLLLPIRLIFAYGAFWCLYTAALRPLTGQSGAEFFERAGNYGLPIAMLVMTAGQQWLERIEASMDQCTRERLATVCVWASAILLGGHGWLALQGKALLVRHLSLVGISGTAIQTFGAIELIAAMACVLRPHPALLVGIATWKVLTEALFIAAGAPIWEFIERGGSYLVPLVGAALVGRSMWSVQPRLARATAAASVAALLLIQPLSAQQASPATTVSSDLLQELQRGGLVVACRHGITSHEREDRMPPNFDDPSQQRVLSPEGEQQVKSVGQAFTTLKIRFGVILASPFDRTKKSAEFMAGPPQIAEALSSTAQGKTPELRELMTGAVDPGANRLVVTHQGMFYRVFKGLRQGSIAEGDCLVVRPNADQPDILAQVTPAEWTRLAQPR